MKKHSMLLLLALLTFGCIEHVLYPKHDPYWDERVAECKKAIKTKDKELFARYYCHELPQFKDKI